MKFEMEQITVSDHEGKIRFTQSAMDGSEYGCYAEMTIHPDQAQLFCQWVMKTAERLMQSAANELLNDEELDEKLNGYHQN